MYISPMTPVGQSIPVSGSTMRIREPPAGLPTEPGCSSHSRPVIMVPPMRSVEPKDSFMTSGPSHSIHALINHAGHGAPDVRTTWSEERSLALRSSSGRRAIRSIMVGTKQIEST